MATPRTVVAVAGRRIDGPDADPRRFPPNTVERVAREVERLLRDEGAVAVVASAACGADLVALEVAREAGIRTRIVLPFDAARFRDTSVTDRPGDWGPRFDAALQHAEENDDVVVLDSTADSPDAAYAAATRRIIGETLALASASQLSPLAVALWDGRPRGETDATKAFIDCARAAHIRTREVSTIPQVD